MGIDFFLKGKSIRKKVIFKYFTEEEHQKVFEILNDLQLGSCQDIVLIDAIDNKVSACDVS